MRGNVGANTGLVEGVDVRIGAVEHAVQFQDIAISVSATEFIASPLEMVSTKTGLMCDPSQLRTSKHKTKTFFCRVAGKTGGCAAMIVVLVVRVLLL